MPPSALMKRVFRPAHNVAQKSFYVSTRFFCNNPIWNNMGIKDSMEDKTVQEIDTKDRSILLELDGVGDADRGRTVRIYKRSRPAGQQFNNDAEGYTFWRVEFINEGARWNNPLMGWTSTSDGYTNQHMDRFTFENKDAAEKWCKRQGFKYLFQADQKSRKRAKSYNATFGLNGIPKANWTPPPTDKK